MQRAQNVNAGDFMSADLDSIVLLSSPNYGFKTNIAERQ